MLRHLFSQPYVQSHYQPLLDGLGLTYPQYIAMVLLWERDGQTVGELGSGSFWNQAP